MSPSDKQPVTHTQVDVVEAIAAGQPIVALETAVLTHGLPRHPIETPTCFAEDSALWQHLATPLHWDESLNANVQLGMLMATAVRNAGAVPASIGVLEGTLRIGLDDDELRKLATTNDVAKASARDLAPLLSSGRSAGTTVAAAIRACSLAQPSPIRVFATGGIGGVHRDWQKRPDISADLGALAREPVAVVASGAKVILDVQATVEMLDALGVLVLGHGTDSMPRFTAAATSEFPLEHRFDDPKEIAHTCQLHWNVLEANSAVLVANPCPLGLESNSKQLDRLVDAGLAEAATLGIEGGEVTPFLLDAIGKDPEANAVSANLALLLANATLAARIAVELASQESSSHGFTSLA